MKLDDLGFDAFFAEHAEKVGTPGLVPARIVADGKAEMWLAGCKAKLGHLTGKLRHDKSSRPVIGDWVLVRDDEQRATINALLPRRTQLVRRAIGKKNEAQVIAANLDLVFIVTAVGDDVNPRRLERYLTTVWEGGATPVLVLNKSDLTNDAAAFRETMSAIANGVEILTTSATSGDGVDTLLARIPPKQTAALVGSSGVGKSSLLNRLIGREAQAIGEVIGRERGRHTTTRRELFVMPGGAILIDTPGMRELGVMEADEGLATTFADIAELAHACRFSDCAHSGDSGCAVQAAVDDGRLEAARFEAYLALQQEIVTNQKSTRQKARHSPKAR